MERPKIERQRGAQKYLKVMHSIAGREPLLFVNIEAIAVGASDASQSLCPHQCGDPKTSRPNAESPNVLRIDQRFIILYETYLLVRNLSRLCGRILPNFPMNILYSRVALYNQQPSFARQSICHQVCWTYCQIWSKQKESVDPYADQGPCRLALESIS